MANWFDSAEVDARVEAQLAKMSLEDKVRLVSGQLAVDRTGTVPPMPEGLPELMLSDGPAGVRIADPSPEGRRSTALPAPIALAATWDEELAHKYGNIIGIEAAASGVNVLLGPAVDIARAPLAGRTFESFGEDPLLAARMVTPEVRAVQAQGVLACIKHYIVNNQEYQRGSLDVQVDERTLHEIYLPAFAAVIQQAQIASVMGSYNRINGTYACENPVTLTGILREELGFRGFVMTDYLASHGMLESAQAGLEWELGTLRWGEKLLAAVQAGEMPLGLLDEMTRRILRPVFGLGLADRPRTLGSWEMEEHSRVAREIAEASLVLLKNEGAILPLDAEKLHSVAVIGVDAGTVSAAGGGSACVRPLKAVSLLEGIQQRLGDAVRVDYAPGVDPVGPGVLLPGPAAIPSGFYPGGVSVSYWNTPDFSGEPLITRTEPRIEFNYGFTDIFAGLQNGIAKFLFKPKEVTGRLSARAEGRLSIPLDGEYELSLTCLGLARLYINDQLVLDTSGAPAVQMVGNSLAEVYAIRLALAGGQEYAVRVEYSNFEVGELQFNQAMLRLGWNAPAGVVDPAIRQACALAEHAGVVIVAARTYETEEIDRPVMTLPDHQDALISALVAVNPKVIVVLMSGSAVDCTAWQESTPAILEAWYAGQEQGSAIARLLFGDCNPSGRLPLTFPRTLQDGVLASPEQYPGVGGKLHYSEGLFVGYRGMERSGLRAQYPFGFGLAYTTFAYSHIEVDPLQGDGTGKISISFRVGNTGNREGLETAQVYLSLPDSTGMAGKRLAGWAQVSLQPGENRRVTICLDPQDGNHPLSFWSENMHGWQIAAGEYRLWVGASSADIRLSSGFKIVK